MRRRSGSIRASIGFGLALLLATGSVVLPGRLERSAGAASTPPPTPVPPNGSPSPFPTSLVTPSPSLAPPPLSSRAALLEDLDTGQILYAKAPRARRPIASLTKLMTALVVMSEADPTEPVAVSAAAASQPGSELGLVAGERIQVRELLYALLLQSSNDAAVALAEHVGGTVDGFLDLMAARGRMLGLSDTLFTSPSGLDDRGYSTARDLATMTRAAYARPLFEKIVKTRFHDIPAPSGPPRRIQNRNVLLWLYPGAIGVKTGFTTPAGHCLVAAVDHEGLRLLAIALGAGGPDAGDVFNDGAALLNYGYSAFQDEVLIHAGDPVGPFRVGGADVRAVAAASLVRLVRRDLLNTVGIVVRMDADLAIPIAAGRRIGSVAATVDGRPAGEVDVVAAATVTGPQSPWPSPQADAGAGRDGGWTRLVHALVALTLAIVEPFL